MCGLWFFYHCCKQMHFLSLIEMDAVLSINNNVSHLSSAMYQASCRVCCQLGLTCSHFEVWCDDTYPLRCDIISSFMKTFHNSFVVPGSLEWHLTRFPSSILQRHKLSPGKFSPLLHFTEPVEGGGDSDLDPSLCSFFSIAQMRPLHPREGGRRS